LPIFKSEGDQGYQLKEKRELLGWGRGSGEFISEVILLSKMEKEGEESTRK